MKLTNSNTLLSAAAAAAMLCGAGLTARADYPAEVLALQPVTYWRFSETGPFIYPDNVATNLGTVATNGVYSDQYTVKGQAGVLPGNAAAACNGGAGQYVRVPWSADLNPGAPFSVEAWLKPDVVYASGSGAVACALASVEAASPRSGWLIYQTETGWNLRFYNQNGTATSVSITGGGLLTTGAWYHVVATFDGTTASLYVNGDSAASGVPSGFVPNVDANFTIGIRGDIAYGWAGVADEVAFYGAALSASQVRAHYDAVTTNSAGYASQVLALNPLLYLRLDEAVIPNPPAANLGRLGALANGLYHNGLMPSASDLIPPAVPGLDSTNRAVVFDGTGNFMSIGYANLPLPWTAVCWLNRQDAPGASAVLMWSSVSGLKLEQWGSTRMVGFTAYGVADYTFNYQAPVGTWVNLAYVGTANGTLLYVNGSLQDSNSASITLPMTSLGYASVDLLSGAVDELATFDQALLEGQLKTLYLTAVGDQNPPGFVNNVPIVSPPGTVYATVPFTLSIDVYGAGPLSYQWRKDGAVVGTGATYTKTSASTSDSGNYDVIVNNPFGAVTSALVNLTVNPAVPAGIAQQPVPRPVYPGGTALFSVTASGTPPFTYQWKKAGASISDATSQTLLITNAGSGDVASYSVGVTNVAGGGVSAGAALSLRTPASASYEAAIVASGPAAYWRLGERSGTTAFDYMGAHDGVYANVTLGLPGYSASDPDAAAGFDPAQPSSVDVADATPFAFIGATPSFTLEAWVNFNDLTAIQRIFSYAGPGFHGIGFGINTASGLRFTTYGVQDFDLSLPAPLLPNAWYHIAGVANGGTFYFYLNGHSVGSIAFTGAGISAPGAPFALGRNPLGTAIEAVNGLIDEAAVYNMALTADQILTHYSVGHYGSTTPPLIAQQPASQVVAVGSSPTFSVQAEGSVPLSYQWLKGAGVIAGATNSSLTLSNAHYTDAGTYSVTITNAIGTTNSAPVTLTVMPPPTFANLTNDLVLHLRFDGDYTDTSGRANDASALVGSPPFLAGKIGQGVHIATTPGNNYLVVSDNAGDLWFDETASFTVAFWVRYTDRFNDVPIIGNAINSTWQLGWVFTDEGGNLEWSLVSTANTGTYLRDPVGSAVIGDGAWHNVLGVVDRGQQMALAYVDGALAGSWSIAGLGALSYGNAITIGQDPTGNYGTATFDLDDLGIWRRALGAYEAQSIYAAAQNSAPQSFDVYGPVKLIVVQSAGQVIFAWQAGTLEFTDELKGAQTVWTPVPGAVVPSCTLAPNAARKFYHVRL